MSRCPNRNKYLFSNYARIKSSSFKKEFFKVCANCGKVYIGSIIKSVYKNSEFSLFQRSILYEFLAVVNSLTLTELMVITSSFQHAKEELSEKDLLEKFLFFLKNISLFSISGMKGN